MKPSLSFFVLGPICLQHDLDLNQSIEPMTKGSVDFLFCHLLSFSFFSRLSKMLCA